ncbi:nuclear transport factor 2 family protein [Sulfitobacter sp. D35]|uniref:nuclear transport factor 2 family protein n=1 Tax=Sulfitobacter sp. D35 TaxID=3083252 RepID=UPI00296E8559|nr:nuclear transport factor 2 family protein [Sulfitobacter sp. D35]MDW4499313.1 nuclear transport factor 2 family protein [Sulfitobacter sp. D35]
MTQTDFQAEKKIVLDYTRALDAATPEAVADTLTAHTTPGFRWRGVHPFNELPDAASIADRLWSPLKEAIGPWQRRPDVFFAGQNILDDAGGVWVVEMGHLMGLWERPFLDLPPTRKIAFLRYAEFHRVEDGRIAETVSYLDLLHLIHQAGLRPFPGQTGADILTPGPRTHDGLLHDPQDPEDGHVTMQLIMDMVEELRSAGVSSPADHIDRFWTPDMCWFGPAGIGASAFRDGYRRGHTGPFEAGLEFVRSDGHGAELAEGRYGGFFGYPSITMRPTGGFMGMPANDTEAEMRIVDIYRRDGDKLAENWIFIDMLHFFAMQGLDVLERLKKHPRT